jgi:hypothetical protein
VYNFTVEHTVQYYFSLLMSLRLMYCQWEGELALSIDTSSIHTSRCLTIDRTGVTEVHYCTTDSQSTIITLLLGTRSVPSIVDCTTNTHKAFDDVQYCTTDSQRTIKTLLLGTRSVPQYIGLHGLTLYHNDALSQLLHTDHIYLITSHDDKNEQRTRTQCALLYWSTVHCCTTWHYCTPSTEV